MLIPHIKMFLASTFYLVILLVIACDNTLIVTHCDLNEQIVVLSLLSPAFERQEVYVGSALPETPPIDVSGAQVRIQDSTNTYIFKEVQPGLYCDVKGVFKASPGTKYDLYVETPNGKRVYSSTRVPGKFEITSIASGDTLEFSNYFSGPPDHVGSQTIPNVEYRESKCAFIYQLWLFLNDSSFYVPKTPVTLELKCDFPWISTERDTCIVAFAKLVVFAWDSTYSKYAAYWAMEGGIPARYWTESFSEFHKNKDYCPNTQTNIIGGLGIFGSASVASVEFYLKYRMDVNPE